MKKLRQKRKDMKKVKSGVTFLQELRSAGGTGTSQEKLRKC